MQRIANDDVPRHDASLDKGWSNRAVEGDPDEIGSTTKWLTFAGVGVLVVVGLPWMVRKLGSVTVDLVKSLGGTILEVMEQGVDMGFEFLGRGPTTNETANTALNLLSGGLFSLLCEEGLKDKWQAVYNYMMKAGFGYGQLDSAAVLLMSGHSQVDELLEPGRDYAPNYYIDVVQEGAGFLAVYYDDIMNDRWDEVQRAVDEVAWRWGSFNPKHAHANWCVPTSCLIPLRYEGASGYVKCIIDQCQAFQLGSIDEFNVKAFGGSFNNINTGMLASGLEDLTGDDLHDSSDMDNLKRLTILACDGKDSEAYQSAVCGIAKRINSNWFTETGRAGYRIALQKALTMVADM